MEKFQWEGITQFVFPEHIGSIEEVVSVDVTPKWEHHKSEESLQLKGIYHIQAKVRFNRMQVPNYSEGILIEHLQFDNNVGYFEYAYPLEVDLPKEIADKGTPKLKVSNVQFFVLDGSSCVIRWDVQCEFESDKVEQPIESSIKRFHQMILIEEEEKQLDNLQEALNIDEDKSEQIVETTIEQESILEKVEVLHQSEENEQVIEGQPIHEKESTKDNDDFLESLREDYTIFTRSNNVF